MNEYWLVGIIEKQRKLDVDGEIIMLDLHWHDDMAGVMPVFTSKEEAQNYADLWDTKPPVIPLEQFKQ